MKYAIDSKKRIEKIVSEYLDLEVQVRLAQVVVYAEDDKRVFFLGYVPDKTLYIVGCYDGRDKSLQLYSQEGDDFWDADRGWEDAFHLENTWRRSGELALWIKQSLETEDWKSDIADFLNKVRKELE